MRRLLFLSAVILLIELFSYLGARGIFWLIKPYFAHAKRAVFIGMFVLTHLFLASFFVGQFRFGMGYMTVLWLCLLAMLMTLAVFVIAKKSSLGKLISPDGLGIRTFGVMSFVGLMALALYNAYTPTVRHISLTVDKPIKPLKIALASDTHLGHLVGQRELNKLADILKQQQADLLLMAGDIMDDDTHAYHAKQMHTALANVVSSVGGHAIASLGNHDLYREPERQAIVDAIKDSGTILLDDKTHTLTLNGTPITIIGRYDDHFEGRKSTAELMAGVDTTHLVVLLDHRPSQIDQNTQLPIDLQVSGHTHNGQVFPANFIVKAINRLGYGHELINGTHVIVSSGYGFWGVPFRLGSQSEVWIINLKPATP